jgi:nicotinate (nicotinamide) nucleotide adenylyltransferase
MTERVHDFQLVSHCHAIIEEVGGNPSPRIQVVSRFKGADEGLQKEVGIFPSSFNPLTNGHMVILQRAAETKGFSEILLVLDAQAMDKDIFGATLADRLLMLQLLLEAPPRFSLGVGNRGLFLTKAEVLKEMYPRRTGITFIVGYDTLARVFDAKYYENRAEALDRLFAVCRFMVANREDRGREAARQLVASVEHGRFQDRVQFFEIPNHLAQISSSRVRQRVMEGKPWVRLVPAGVRDFIEEVNLYKPDRGIGPRGQRINLYDVRTQVLARLFALYPEGRVEIDVGKVVNRVVEGMKDGKSLKTMLDTISHRVPMPMGEGGELQR